MLFNKSSQFAYSNFGVNRDSCFPTAKCKRTATLKVVVVFAQLAGVRHVFKHIEGNVCETVNDALARYRRGMKRQN